jgi:ATP-dependent Lhr-like helicase
VSRGGQERGVPRQPAAGEPATAQPATAQPADAQVLGGGRVLRLPAELVRWFEQRGWRAFPFQRELWQAYLRGDSGLLHATTGSGKTYAVWFAALIEALRGGTRRPKPRPYTVLWVTPMRALAADTARALAEPLDALGLDWTVGMRTGDTTGAQRARQQRRPPTALVTTPESLSVMLAQSDAESLLGAVKLVVVDEWHELLGSKRGVQVQLALARIARFSPDARIWGLSATIGNLAQARDALLGSIGRAGALVQGRAAKRVVVDTLIPDVPDRFPWAGHLGMRMVEPVAREIESASTTLVFTNVRSHAEQWYQALLEARPEWAGSLALHHGSLDRRLRDWVELGLKEGRLKAVVCTSSLDLGVDFLPVERVIQIGSPKGIARLLQRAGRSGHAPGRVSRVSCVPTHSFELIEAAAARIAAGERRIESQTPPEAPIDVLVQHMVTVALGGGFEPDALFAEVTATWAYRNLARSTFDWALDFVTRGGALHAYPEYRRVVQSGDGQYRVPDPAIARRHRMSIGTITADSAMEVRFISGGRVGTVEESFVSRLKPGQAFLLGGRLLSLVRIREMTAYVTRAKAGTAAVPRWMGGRSPLSTELAQAVVDLIGRAARGDRSLPELRAVSRLVDLQQRWSVMPQADELLVETVRTREGHHLFCFPFAGRLVHTGLASLFGWRVSRAAPNTFSIAISDYGFELLSPVPVDWPAAFAGDLLDDRNLQHDLLESLNAGELARRQFREIARVSGLVFTGFPGQPKRARELQASAGLLHDVFEKHDPGNLLLAQARAEVMRDELDLARLAGTLARMRAMTLRMVAVEHPTPFAFPLMAARIREKVSTEKVGERIARMVAELERAAGAG